MVTMQPEVVRTADGAVVLQFAPRAAASARLSLGDRMDVARWQGSPNSSGYGRLVIHEREPMDPPEVESYLAIYRRDAMWARWGIARSGGSVLAWCCHTGADIGRYATVGEALAALLMPERPIEPDPARSNVVRAFGC